MNKHFNRAATLFLELMGVYSLLALILETLDCHVSGGFVLWAVALCLTTWFSACYRRGLLIGMPLAALLLYLVYQNFGANPVAQLNDLFDRITGVYYEHFYAPGSSYPYLNAVSDHSMILLFLAFLFSAYLASSLTTRSGRIFMVLLGTAPFFAMCLSANGRPSYAPVVCMILFWVLVLISGGSYEADSNDGKAVFTLALPVVLVLSVVLWACHPERYEIDERDVHTSEQFDRISQALTKWLGGDDDRVTYPDQIPEDAGTATAKPSSRPENETAPWHTGDGQMDLTQSYDPALIDRLLLTVRSDVNGTLYLRTVSYGLYQGTSWSAALENAPISSLPLTAKAIGDAGEAHSLSVQTAVDLDTMCVPYYSLQEKGLDSYVPNRRNSYRVDHLLFRGALEELSLSGRDAQNEKEYADFAHAYYTQLPQDTRDAMLAYCDRAGLSPSDPNIVELVAAYIQSVGVYRLDTQPYPSTDYAMYFLSDAREGYCIHFTTAATVMYRALGIPARVTEGFLVDVRAGEDVEVRGDCAHSWVEVYRDGIGWIPVEVTGRSGPQPSEEPSEEQSQELPGEDTSAAVTPLPVSEQSGDGGQELSVGVIAVPEPGGEGAEEKSASGSVWLRWILGILVIAAILPLWRLFLRLRMQSRLSRKDSRRAAVTIWQYAAKAAKFGAKIPFSLRNTAEKASFSKHPISQEELNESRALLQELLENTYAGLSPWRKFVYRFLYGLK